MPGSVSHVPATKQFGVPGNANLLIGILTSSEKYLSDEDRPRSEKHHGNVS